MKANKESWEPKCLISIIMVTYNSEQTIEIALKSIRNQEFDQNQIELLVLDGGSTDKTVEIAEKYDAKIVTNEHRLPEPGKIKGMQLACGKYVLIMDSDEEMASRTILKERYDLLESYEYLHCISIGTVNPPGYNPIGIYINAVGDPFSCFVYRTYKLGMNRLIWEKNILQENKICIGKFSHDDIRPIGDSGVMMDLKYIHENYAREMTFENTATLFDMIIRDTGYVGCIKDDDHIHRSKSDFRTYIKKLKFRIVNNVNQVENVGYGARAQNSNRLNMRKYAFPFYTISLILPIFDGIRMTKNYSSMVFLLHPFFTWYVLIEILHQYALKFLGKNKKIQTYGE